MTTEPANQSRRFHVLGTIRAALRNVIGRRRFVWSRFLAHWGIGRDQVLPAALRAHLMNAGQPPNRVDDTGYYEESPQEQLYPETAGCLRARRNETPTGSADHFLLSHTDLPGMRGIARLSFPSRPGGVRIPSRDVGSRLAASGSRVAGNHVERVPESSRLDHVTRFERAAACAAAARTSGCRARTPRMGSSPWPSRSQRRSCKYGSR